MVFNLFKRRNKQANLGIKPERVQLRVKEVIQQTPDASTLVFETQPNIEYTPGQFLTLILKPNGKEVRRCYSLNSSPFLEEHPAVTIKRVDNGLVSNYINDHLQPGQVIDTLEALGNFTLIPDSQTKRELVLIGGGSGITPLMSILKSVLTVESESRVTLIYANRDSDSIIFQKELNELANKYTDRFRIIHVLDNPPKNWEGEKGMLSSSQLTRLLNELPEAISDRAYYVCGPEGLMELVFEVFEKLNINPEQTHKESFVAGNTSPDAVMEAGADGQQDQMVLVRHAGEEFELEVPAGKSVLEAAIASNIELPYSCQSGLCTACMGKLVSGKMDLSKAEALSKDEIDQGYCLTCVGKPLSDDVVIEI